MIEEKLESMGKGISPKRRKSDKFYFSAQKIKK